MDTFLTFVNIETSDPIRAHFEASLSVDRSSYIGFVEGNVVQASF